MVVLRPLQERQIASNYLRYQQPGLQSSYSWQSYVERQGSLPQQDLWLGQGL